jgi:outer membrane protein assembly factor BamB
MGGVQRRRVAGLVLALTAACSGSSTPTPTPSPTPSPTSSASPVPTVRTTPSPASNPTSSWPTYHRSGTRDGDAGASLAALSAPLQRAWVADLDGAVYGSPVLVGATAVVATENDSVYALDVATGRRLWRRHLGTPVRRADLPCGNIDPLGITSTPAYDERTGSVFVVAETTGAHHTLWALDARTGAPRWHRGLDVARGRDRHAEQQRSALLVTAGRVITAFGGLAGDCGDYVGYLTSVPTTGEGATSVYAVPTRREAGVWAAAGPVVDGAGRVLVASGNGAATGGRWDGSDSVLALDPVTLRLARSFHPDVWADDNARDLDLGSLSPVPVAGKVLIAGKRGVAYLLSSQLALLDSLDGCSAFGGAAVRGATAYLPCTSGLRAVTVRGASLAWGWEAPGIPGSPVLAGDAVYALDPAAQRFHVLSLRTGARVASLDVGRAISRFASPTVAGRMVLLPTMSGVVAVR